VRGHCGSEGDEPASAFPESTNCAAWAMFSAVTSGLEGVVELEAGERGDGGAAIGSAVRIGDGQPLESRMRSRSSEGATGANLCASTRQACPRHS